MVQNMSVVQRNSISEFDIATICFSDLRWRYATGISLSKGQGRNKEYTYRNGVMTALGDIEVGIWYKLMEQLIEREHEQWLLEALIQWEHEHNYTKDTASELRKSALQAHSSRIFDCPEWVGFVMFNKRYRPEVYAQANLVTVINECCDTHGEVTQEQIDRSFGGAVHCPHCGRWSSYTVCTVNGKEE